MILKFCIVVLVLLLGIIFVMVQDKILNVSYDIVCELFEVLNFEFQIYWKEKLGCDVIID